MCAGPKCEPITAEIFKRSQNQMVFCLKCCYVHQRVIRCVCVCTLFGAQNQNGIWSLRLFTKRLFDSKVLAIFWVFIHSLGCTFQRFVSTFHWISSMCPAFYLIVFPFVSMRRRKRNARERVKKETIAPFLIHEVDFDGIHVYNQKLILVHRTYLCMHDITRPVTYSFWQNFV